MKGQEGQGHHSGHGHVTENGLPLSPVNAVDGDSRKQEGPGLCKPRPDLNVWPGFSYGAGYLV